MSKFKYKSILYNFFLNDIVNYIINEKYFVIPMDKYIHVLVNKFVLKYMRCKQCRYLLKRILLYPLIINIAIFMILTL